MEAPLFRSALEALKFALNQQPGKIARSSVNKIAAPSLGRSRLDLSGLEIPGQAGMVLAEVNHLEPMIKYYLVTKYSRHAEVCSCGSSCCSGHRPNWTWVEALDSLVECVNDEIVRLQKQVRQDMLRSKKVKPTPDELLDSTLSSIDVFRQQKYATKQLRKALIAKHFGRTTNLEELAKFCKVSSTTVTAHRKLVVTILGQVEKVALSDLDKRLVRVGIVGPLD